jgi:hypothetical protein
VIVFYHCCYLQRKLYLYNIVLIKRTSPRTKAKQPVSDALTNQGPIALVPTCRSSPRRATASTSKVAGMVAPPVESGTLVNAPSMANVVSQLTSHFDLEISPIIEVPPIMSDTDFRAVVAPSFKDIPEAITALQQQGILDVTNPRTTSENINKDTTLAIPPIETIPTATTVLVMGKEKTTSIAVVDKKADGGAQQDATTKLQQQYHIAVPRDDEGWAARHVLIDMSEMKNRTSDADLALAYCNEKALSFQFFLDQEQNQKNAWFFGNCPRKKLYPDNHQPSYISTSCGATGIQKWLVQHHLSQKVCRYFSGIDECVGVNKPTLQPMPSCFKIDNICIFPFLQFFFWYTESPKIDNANKTFNCCLMQWSLSMPRVSRV